MPEVESLELSVPYPFLTPPFKVGILRGGLGGASYSSPIGRCFPTNWLAALRKVNNGHGFSSVRICLCSTSTTTLQIFISTYCPALSKQEPRPAKYGAWTEAVPSRNSQEDCQSPLGVQREQKCRCYGTQSLTQRRVL